MVTRHNLNDGTANGLTIVRAAQYVRMSTDHQRYSTENQSAAIQQYADSHAMTIVRTYADSGKSGLNIGGREALKRLIHDVQNGQIDFEVVLVYDISRWGRFQDADESAYYEYLCRRAGIRLIYCAEQFSNDGSMSTAIMKSLKRVMAGEYSRELSSKVFMGQCRLVELGYRQGGCAGYGLRRLLIDEQGRAKAELKYGEHKSLQTDRVILIPGPAGEVETVRRIYQMFVFGGLGEQAIADRLNLEGIKATLGRVWNRYSVHKVLTSEKYIGNNVYNKSSFKLKTKKVSNAPDMWVRNDGAFEGIVDATIFKRANEIILNRSTPYGDQEMLDLLGQLHVRVGGLSGLIIDKQENMPSSDIYRRRFGSLIKAYREIGYSPERDYRHIEINVELRERLSGIADTLVAGLNGVGATAESDPKTRKISVNNEFTVSVILARCHRRDGGSYHWKIRLREKCASDITIVVRMRPDNKAELDYYLFPGFDISDVILNLKEKTTYHLMHIVTTP